MKEIKPGNIITMIFQSLYGGLNNISVGVFGIPLQDSAMIVVSIIAFLVLFAMATGIRRKKSFSLQPKKS